MKCNFTRQHIEEYKVTVAQCHRSVLIDAVEDCAEEIGESNGEIVWRVVEQLIEIAVRRGANRDAVTAAATASFNKGRLSSSKEAVVVHTEYAGPVYPPLWRERFLGYARRNVSRAYSESQVRLVLRQEAYKMGWFSANFTEADLALLVNAAGTAVGDAEKKMIVAQAFFSGKRDPVAKLKNDQYIARYAARQANKAK